MNTLPSFLIKFSTIILFTFLIFPHSSYAQKVDICENEDCLPDIFFVELNEPSKPADGNYAPQRTENFKTAYLSFLEISSNYKQSLEWKDKYDGFQLGGINCLRHYKLESAFAHEYLQNTDFRKFIDEQYGANTDLKETGFESSRRAINLEKRMKSKCSKEVKKVYLANLPSEFNALGIDLGYFDTQGNSLKSLSGVVENSKNDSKKGQIEKLKMQLVNLPLGVSVTTKIDALYKSDANLNVKKSSLKNSDSDIKSLFNIAFSKQNDLQMRLNELQAKTDASSQQKQNLIETLQNLTVDAEVLNSTFSKQKKELDSAAKMLKQSQGNLKGLTATLSDLEKRKKELTALLNDKPKKILDELTQKVADVVKESNSFSENIKEAEKTEKVLLEKLNTLSGNRENLFDNLLNNSKNLDDLAADTDMLSQKILSKEAVTKCKEDLEKIADEFDSVSQQQNWFIERMSQIKDMPQKLLSRILGIKILHSDLKEGKNGILLDKKTEQKLEFLSEKAKVLGEATKLLTGEKDKLQVNITNITAQVDAVQNLLKNQNNFADGNCDKLKETENKSEKIKKEQNAFELQLKELEENVKNTKEQTDEIEQDTKRATKILREEKTLKETYGKDIKLEPVTQKEWSESFAVKRQYWDAVFHPDNEVVEGFKGKYFQVKLKDAEKKVKLLFGPGKYSMSKSAFRESYGATIGAFVSEALNFTKEEDENKVILFIQGSADIVGQNTFRGKLDADFLYTEVNVLPQKDGTESFGSNPTAKNIPTRNFKNADLPDLRGNFLKEMISVYSKKLEPVLLEGKVKKNVDKSERNAVIYLFIPEALLQN